MEIICLILVVAIYFLPWIMAYSRKHKQVEGIALTNLFFGWTFIGWLVALIWSVSQNNKKE